MSPAAATSKGALFARAGESLGSLGCATGPQTHAYYVPGRIEVLGKHTDYAGGRSLLCAVERGICLLASPREDAEIRVVDALQGTPVAFRLDPALVPPSGQWANYPMTVARRMARNFPTARRGADIAFASDLPAAVGLSSSSVLIVATFLALAEINRLHTTREYLANLRTDEALAGYLACIENGQSFGALEGDRGVGTYGGTEDHAAILCCRPGRLSLFSFLPVRYEKIVALPEEFRFVIGVSGIAAEKTGAAGDAYNRAVHTARAILELWNVKRGRSDISLAAALDSSPSALDRVREILLSSSHPDFDSKVLLERLGQFHWESTMTIPSVVEAIARQDWESVGALVARSQHDAEYLLGNQIPETIALARSARELGAVAASAFGAGFGGSVWALVRAQDVEVFKTGWEARYREEFPAAALRAQFFASRPGPAATRLEM